MRGIASPLPPLRIHPRPQDGVFCGVFIKRGKIGSGLGLSVHRQGISVKFGGTYEKSFLPPMQGDPVTAVLTVTKETRGRSKFIQDND
jgi:hypothetical protein